MAEARACAQDIIEARWSDIVKLAAVLAERRRLTGKEVEAILSGTALVEMRMHTEPRVETRSIPGGEFRRRELVYNPRAGVLDERARVAQ